MASIWRPKRRSRSSGESLDDDYGLKILAEGKAPLVDIVAIHGLNGHWKRSWTSKDGKFWLQDFLPGMIPNARICSYGYDARTHGTTAVSHQTIHDHALSLVSSLVRERRFTKSDCRPIVFVAHSLGGIVLKNALIHSHNTHANHLPEHKSIKLSTYGILFLGTPQQGIEGANIAAFCLDIGSIFVDTNSTYHSNLQRDSSLLQQQCDQYLFISTDFVTKCFYETRPTPILAGYLKMIVPRSSAVLPGAVNVEAIEINSNHLDMAKFSSAESGEYKKIAHSIAFMVSEAPDKVNASWIKEREILAIGSRPPASFLVYFPQDTNFIGRKSMLDEIRRSFSRIDVHQRLALIGIGGAGKSGIALEFIYNLRQRSPQTSIFWVHGSSRARFLHSYEEIAQIEDIPGRDDPKKNILELVAKWLQRPNSGRWFMVLDSADDDSLFFTLQSNPTSQALIETNTAPKDNLDLAQYLPTSSNGKILVTTRNRRAGAMLCESENYIDVPPLSPVEAHSLLEKKLKQNIPVNEESQELLKELEYLPLAIIQATSFIVCHSSSASNYLQLLRQDYEKREELMGEEFADLRRDRYVPNSVIATWMISFEQIRRKHPKSAEVLSLISIFDRQGIPKAFIDEGFSFGALEYTKALGVLLAYHLIVEQIGGDVFEMHRLVQLSTKTWLKSKTDLSNWEKEGLRVLASCFPNGEYETWQQCTQYLPHADTVINYCAEDESVATNRSSLLQNTAWYLCRQGRFHIAEERARRGASLRQTILGSTHELTLKSFDTLGRILRFGGKYKESEEILSCTLKAWMETRGALDLETLASKCNLASALQYQGRWEEAATIGYEALEGRLAILGAEHPSTLISRSNLAVVWTHQKKYPEAASQLSEVIESRERILGASHPDTLVALNNFGGLLSLQGKHQEAEAIHMKLLSIRKNILPPEHPDLLMTESNLGVTLQNQGKFVESKEIAERVLAIRERTLGLEHPETLTTVGNIAKLFEKLEKFPEAVLWYRRLLDGFSKKLGNDHPYTKSVNETLQDMIEKEKKVSGIKTDQTYTL